MGSLRQVQGLGEERGRYVSVSVTREKEERIGEGRRSGGKER